MPMSQFTPKPIARPFFFDKKNTPSLDETLAIFKPIIAGIYSLRDEVPTINGYPAFLDYQGEWSRIDQALRGWIDCWKRLDPNLDTTPLQKLAKKLEYGTPIFEDELQACVACLNRQIGRFLVLPVSHILHHTMTEQIAIQLEQMGIKEAA